MAATISLAQVLEVALTGDDKAIRKWVETQLPIAKPMDIKSEHSSTPLTPENEQVLVAAIKRLPYATKVLFKEELARKGVMLHHGDIADVWDGAVKGDYLGIRHWVRNVNLHGCTVDAYGTLIRSHDSDIPDKFVDGLVRVVQRVTPTGAAEFLLNELCKKGLFLPEDQPKKSHDGPDVDPQKWDQSGESPAPATAPNAWDFSRMLVRLAKNNLLFRPKPPRREHFFLDNLMPIGRFSPLHHFVVNYFCTFDLKQALEAWVSWYELYRVPHTLFNAQDLAKAELLQPTAGLARHFFQQNLTESGLCAPLLCYPTNRAASTERESERGVYEIIDRELFLSSEIKYEYLAPLLARIDMKDLKPVYEKVHRQVSDLTEFRSALQRRRLVDSNFRVADNMEASKSDATLFSYTYAHAEIPITALRVGSMEEDPNKPDGLGPISPRTVKVLPPFPLKINLDPFLRNSPWAARLGAHMSLEEMMRAEREDRVAKMVREWLRNRAPAQAYHNTLTQIKPEDNGIWDAAINMGFRMALSNYKPRQPPKYEYPEDVDEFDRKRITEKTYDSQEEVVNTCHQYVDLVASEDTSDPAVLRLFMDILEVVAKLRPDVFGKKKLVEALDKAYIAGKPFLRDLRQTFKFQRAEPFMTQREQLPTDLRRVFTALGFIYSKDCTEPKERREVLRVLTCLHLAYNVQFHPLLAQAWKKLESGPTAAVLEWLLGVSSVFRLNPIVFMNMMTSSGGFFAGRVDAWEHLALLVGVPCGLLPAFRTNETLEQHAPFDKTSDFLYHMPSCISRPQPGVSEARWIGNAFLARALQSVSSTAVPFDPVLCMLAADLGASREDAFLCYMLAHEAQFSRTSKEVAYTDADMRRIDQLIDRRLSGQISSDSQADVEETILRLCGKRRFAILVQALDLFYPVVSRSKPSELPGDSPLASNVLSQRRCVLGETARVLMFFARGNFNEARNIMQLIVANLKANDGSEGYYMWKEHDNRARVYWAGEMCAQMMRYAWGYQSQFPRPSKFQTQWWTDLFTALEFTPGFKVLRELTTGVFGDEAVGRQKLDWNASEAMYDDKMAEFKDFARDEHLLWEFTWERQTFYDQAEKELTENGCNPVMIGALFFNMWHRLCLQKAKRVPAMPITTEEEIFLIYSAVYQWNMCDKEVYGEVIRRLHARIYALMFSANLETLTIKVAGVDTPLNRDAFFVASTLPVPEEDPIVRQIEKGAAVVNDAPSKDDMEKEIDRQAAEQAKQLEAQKKNLPPDSLMDKFTGIFNKEKQAEKLREAKANAKSLEEQTRDATLDLPDLDPTEEDIAATEEEEQRKALQKQLNAAPQDVAAEAEQALQALEEEKARGFVAPRLDLNAFNLYDGLKLHEFMPQAAVWETRWVEEERLEHEARSRGVPLEALLAQAAQAVPDDSKPKRLDLHLFIETMDRLLKGARYQQAYALANDILEHFPKEWNKNFPELKIHMERIRLVFYICGLDRLSSRDLIKQDPAADSKELEQKGRDAPVGSTKKSERYQEIPLAANFANIRWLPNDLGGEMILLSRKRVAWNSTTRLSTVHYMLKTLYPSLDLDTIKHALAGDKKNGTVTGRIEILLKLAEGDVELRPTTDLFIAALTIYKLEYELTGKKVPLPEILGVISESIQQGTLQVLTRLATELRTSVLKMVQLKPHQVILQCLSRLGDLQLVKDYLRSLSPVTNGAPLTAEQNAAAGVAAVQHITNAYAAYLEKRVEAEVDRIRREVRQSNSEEPLMSIDAWSRGRLLAFVGTAGERRLLHELGRSLFAQSRGIDVITNAAQRGVGTLQALQTMKLELLYAAYFAYFAGSHTQGMVQTLAEMDSVLVQLKNQPTRFAAYIKRTLFLTGEYKALKESMPVVIKSQQGEVQERSAKARAELIKLNAAAEADGKGASSGLSGPAGAGGMAGAGRVGAGGAAAGGAGGAGGAAGILSKEQLEQVRAGAQDEVELDLTTRRNAYIQALLKALQSLEGYELFRELETIAGDFKSLAWRYSELKWYKQALDCHRLAELIHVEMSFIPAKLSRFNFVNPDANDIKLMWSYYTQRTPVKEADVAVGSSDYMPSRRSSLELLRAKRSEEEERALARKRLTSGQLELLIADSILSGIQAPFLEASRREHATKAKHLDAMGKPSGRVYKSVHALVEQAVQHLKAQVGDNELTMDQVQALISSGAGDGADYVGNRSHVFVDDGDADSRPFPSTVLFFHVDKFGRWNLGVDATNSYAAQQTLQVLTNLKKTSEAELFSHLYYEK